VLKESWHRRFLLDSSSGLQQLEDFFASTFKLHCVLPGRTGANDRQIKIFLFSFAMFSNVAILELNHKNSSFIIMELEFAALLF
jgi:hypothetical protein